MEKPTLDLPDEDTLNTISEENMKKTIEKLGNGKFAFNKYVDSLTTTCDIFTEKNPDSLSEDAQTSLTALKTFKENLSGQKKNPDIDEDTKKAFAYHIEVCKAAMSDLFNLVTEDKEPAEEKPEVTETPVEALFKKAPAVALDVVYQVVNSGVPKLVREKKQLNEELQQLCQKMEYADESLSHQILGAMGKEAEGCWRFLQEHGEQILELYSKLGKAELVILSVCRDVVAEVFEKIVLCRKNWTGAASALGRYPNGATALVAGPLVATADYEDKENLMGLVPDNSRENSTTGRFTLKYKLQDFKNKIENAHPAIVEHEKSNLPEGYEPSLNFILKDLPPVVAGAPSKFLAVEEKLYIGHHMNVIKGSVNKMMELSIARKVLDGKYVFHPKDNYNKNHRGERARNRNGYGGPKSGGKFNHRGSY